MSAADKPQEELRFPFADLAAQGIDIHSMGLAYARRTLPHLDELSPPVAYVHRFMDGMRATLGLLPLIIGDKPDWQEFFTRLYDADVLPVVGSDGL